MRVYNKTLELTRNFVRKYPFTVAWRLSRHARVIEMFLNEGEEVQYAFTAQENDNPLDIISTCIVAVTNKRLLIARKRMLWGYFYHSITPDMFNDIEIRTGLIWGKIYIDTIKEVVKLSNLDLKSLPEIEEEISEAIMSLKKEYAKEVN